MDYSKKVGVTDHFTMSKLNIYESNKPNESKELSITLIFIL